MKLTEIKHLLTPDALEGAVEADPLSAAASGVDTTFPLIAPDRIVRFKLDKVTVGPTKDNAASNPTAKEVVTLKFKTEKETVSRDGKTLQPGFPCSMWINLVPFKAKEEGKKDFTIEDVKRGIALFLKAAGMADLPMATLRDEPSRFEGLVFDMKVGVRPGKNGFTDANTLSFILPA